jgi:hypothetical protein
MSLILSGTDGLSDVDGSAATPAIRGTDANTGIFFPAADTIAFAEGGAEIARFDSSGNFGLGVTPTNNTLGKTVQVGQSTVLTADASANRFWLGSNWYYNSGDKYIANGFSTLYSQQSGTHQWFNAASGTAGNAISFTQAMTLDASGNLLVGYTSSGGVRGVFSNGANGLPATSGTTQTYGALRVRGGDNAVIDFGCNSTNTWIQATDIGGLNNAYNLLLNPNGGNLLVQGTTYSTTAFGVYVGTDGATTSRLSVGGSSSSSSVGYSLYSTGAGLFRFYVNYAGTIFATSTSISAISDATLKENVRDLETGLTEVMALRPRRFDWINGDATNVAGFVAQEVEQVLPELVADYIYNKDEEGNDITKKSLKMGDILPTLVKAIQEQQALITTLTARITALESA